jgi:rhodanese-related sulfurtransferase
MRRQANRLALQAAGLMTLAAACSVAVNLMRPSPLPWSDAWSRRVETQALDLGLALADAEQAFALYEEGAHLIFDARPVADFAAGHLPGAHSLPGDAFDLHIGDYLPLLYPEQPILVYCSGEACDESVLVSRGLIDMGFTNLVLFASGIQAWTEAGFPLEEGL